MKGYKKKYKIVRIGSFPTESQHGRGKHNFELSNVHTKDTLLITWKTTQRLSRKLTALDIKEILFYEKSVRNSNIIKFKLNQLIRLIMLFYFTLTSVIIIISKSPKLIHIHSPMFLGIGMIIKILSFGRVKLLITYHGEDFIHTKNSILLLYLNQIFVDKALFISWTQYNECKFIKSKYWTPNGINKENWIKPNEIIRKPLSFLAVGKFKPQKNFSGLLISWKHIIQDIPEASLTIIGEGELDNQIKNLVNELGLNQSVKILPFQNKQELNKYYWANEFFISNSIWEGFAKVVLEALACDCKIALTSVDSHKKVFRAWPFLIKPNSKISTEQVIRKILIEDYDWIQHNRILNKYSTIQLQSNYKTIINEIVQLS